jgi:hypothetical protein
MSNKILLLRLQITLITAIGLIYIGSVWIKSYYQESRAGKLKLVTKEEELFENFLFKCDNERVGLSFNAKFGEHLRNLITINNYANLTEFPAFVTAFSENHLSEGLRLIEHVAKYFPMKKLTVYDIGLSKEDVENVRNKTHVLLKRFNFSAYPSYVKDLKQYRWKPLIIAQELLQHPAVMWMDGSVYWEKGNISELLIRTRNGEISPWSLMDNTRHSTFAATTPGMMDFFNCSKERLYDIQLSANFMLIYRTPEIVRNVLKWWLLCALEPECMAPKGAQLQCQFSAADLLKTYANCHRYDQSAINILLAKATAFRGYKNYYHNPNFARIVRVD